MSYAANDAGMFEPEYAEVYGVPFSFIPSAGSGTTPAPGPIPTRVRALDDRIACEITFPRLQGYRYDVKSRRLGHRFTDDSRLALSTADIPTRTENAPIVGEKSIHTLDDLKKRRMTEVAFLLAKLTLEKYFRQDGEERTDRPKTHRFDNEVQAWLFPQVLNITKAWLAECVRCKDRAFPQLLLLIEFAHDAADRIYKAIVQSEPDTPALKPILRSYDVLGSTRYVDFDTTKAVYATRADKSHVSHVVADTGSWEQKMAQVLEDMPEVTSYVKNQGLQFTIPYTINGEEKSYYPDFLVRIGSPSGRGAVSSVGAGLSGPPDLTLILEVSGEARKDKAAKTSTARTLWVPAVNNHGGFGRWAFVEVTDPWDCEGPIRAAIAAASMVQTVSRPVSGTRSIPFLALGVLRKQLSINPAKQFAHLVEAECRSLSERLQRLTKFRFAVVGRQQLLESFVGLIRLGITRRHRIVHCKNLSGVDRG